MEGRVADLDNRDTNQHESSGISGPEGLDEAFLRFIGVEHTTQRAIQAVYLPYFAGCRRVVDLGCGDGDFVALLREGGHIAMGVDADSRVVARAQADGQPVLLADVSQWLTGEADAVEQGATPAWDGLFSAHLVEHLPYDRVLSLCALAHRILAPGGVVVLATPNVAALQAHLDGYYRHFGHVTFYHPELLSFFLVYSGFTVMETGANPKVPSSLFVPVVRRLNEHQVALDRIEAVSGELLPVHTDLAQASEAAHGRFGTVFARFSLLHQQIQRLHGLTEGLKLNMAPAGPGLPERLRARIARWLMSASVDHFNREVDHLRDALDTLAHLNSQIAELAELWVDSQRMTDRLNDLLARQGTLVRDVVGANREMEAAVRALMDQVDKPFEAYVVARKPAELPGDQA